MATADREGVFLSWSKPRSGEIAGHLKPFLEDVLGNATIFMSQALEPGARWSIEIPQHLESCNAGLILVTAENSREPWLHFEAGALSKRIDASRVVPLLCGANIGDIQGTPLSLFQAKSLKKSDFLNVCILFGQAFAVDEANIRRRFDRSWPELEQAVAGVTRSSTTPKREIGVPDLMAVLERVAGQVAVIETSLRQTSAGALDHYAPRGMFSNTNPFLPAANTIGGQLALQATTLTPEQNREFLEFLKLERERIAEHLSKKPKKPSAKPGSD